MSSTAVDVTWTNSVSTAGRVKYACVGSPLNWQTANDTTVGQQHTVHLTGLSANSEYVFRAESASDTSFANASVSEYFDVVTKTSLPSLTVESPGENAVLSGTVSVEALASDSAGRFSTDGISVIQLCVDSLTLSPSSSSPGDYLFSLDTTQLTNGSHRLVVSATDDYWNSATYCIDVYVQNSTSGILAQSVHALNQ